MKSDYECGFIISDPTGIERLWLQEQLKEQVLSGKPFANLFGDGESMEKKTSRIKERFLPVSSNC